MQAPLARDLLHHVSLPLQISHRPFAPSTTALLSRPLAQHRKMVTSTPKVTDPSDIPTLADLYTSRELPVYSDIAFKHDESLNKRVSIWRGQSLLLPPARSGS
jgi:hypothetical protein